MSTEHRSDSVEGVGHERRDINVGTVTIFIVMLEIFMLFCCGLCLVFQKGYLHWLKISSPRISTMAVYVQDPPEPRLQVDPTEDLQKYRDVQNSLTTSYGWVDASQGTVRLPLERAKELVAAESKS